MVTELNEGDCTLYKQMIQNMRSLCGGAQPLGMLIGVGQFL